MTKRGNLITVDKDQRLEDAIRLMDKHKISRVLVTDNKKVMGIITEKDVMRRLGAGKERKFKTGRIHVSGAMTKEMITVPKGTTHVKIAKIMIKQNISSVGIEKNGETVDLVTKTDIIKNLTNSEKTVGDFCTKKPEKVKLGATIVMARKLILKEGIHSLLVVESGNLRGILALKDITKGLDQFREALDIYQHADIKRLKVDHMMTRNPKVIKDEQSVGEAVKIMLDRHMSGLPVSGKWLMIITKTDLVRGIADGNLP